MLGFAVLWRCPSVRAIGDDNALPIRFNPEYYSNVINTLPFMAWDTLNTLISWDGIMTTTVITDVATLLGIITPVEPEFCSLDEIEELSDDLHNPETLAMRKEKAIGCPLAFYSESTQRGVTLIELLFILVLFSFWGAIGYIAWHFLSKYW